MSDPIRSYFGEDMQAVDDLVDLLVFPRTHQCRLSSFDSFTACVLIACQPLASKILHGHPVRLAAPLDDERAHIHLFDFKM
ncbi:hypothetical protein OUZ56_009484 [Daphnia magna]|uniref:Uncharacterized protein n=1 Tax=Daphnia magna TaxID=35525 RepID=A0ABR0AG51_9CRUS|nr:hypothetical protein OUZ56_009484 [Daphnia magna]